MEPLHYDKDKIARLNEYMEKLIQNDSTVNKRDLYDQYEDVITQVTPLDLFFVSPYQEDSDVPLDVIQETSGKFINLFYHALERAKPDGYDDSLLSYLLQEQEAIAAHLDTLKHHFKKDRILASKTDIQQGFEALLGLDRVYLKYQNILFPALEERAPTKRPFQVLWSLQDDILDALKRLLRDLSQDDPDLSALIYELGAFYFQVMEFKTIVEMILLPVAKRLLSSDVLSSLYRDTLSFGYLFIEHTPPPEPSAVTPTLEDGMFHTKTGSLSFAQLETLLQYLPLDLTFVDANDKVTYFNDRPSRHFPRNPSILGRSVQHCHPPKSVHIVNDIVDAFKAGTKDMAEFWIEFRGTFLYITYYAMRNADGTYQGTLEASQDVSRIRSLEGERRLLDW